MEMTTNTVHMMGVPKISGGDLNCRHSWVYDNAVYTVNPPIVYRICSKCGRVEAYQEQLPDILSFEELYKHFHLGD